MQKVINQILVSASGLGLLVVGVMIVDSLFHKKVVVSFPAEWENTVEVAEATDITLRCVTSSNIDDFGRKITYKVKRFCN